ncbi:sulfonate ABC transporter ATP-binding lipoprotein [Tistrella bauzanensis]|jgi:NitT/TauT family transport system ATP-binding protein|nr:sulfonate ABC transporter ATP-binding lipoprotein [Tistrella bauzanensis]
MTLDTTGNKAPPAGQAGTPMAARAAGPDAARTGSDGAAVSARRLSLVYQTADQPVHALQDVDIDIRPGDFVSLIGPSGCGKTTLLRVIADLEQPTGGSITVAGRTPDEARRDRAYGYVFQAPALMPWRTVERNVMLPLELARRPKAERQAIVREKLALVGLDGFARKYPWQLSGGMQQRASIARALSFAPELLLMDEPFGALDEITRDHLNLALNALWRQTGLTCVFVTHSIAEAVFLSTRIIVMSPRPGKILEEITCDLPAERTLEMRESAEFQRVAALVRAGLAKGHSYD